MRKSSAKIALLTAAIGRTQERFRERVDRLMVASKTADPAGHASDVEALGPGFPDAVCGALAHLVVETVEALNDRPEIRIAVLERAELLCDGWDLRDHGELPPPVLRGLSRLWQAERGTKPAATSWPGDVAANAVSAALRRVGDPDATRVADALDTGLLSLRPGAILAMSDPADAIPATKPDSPPPDLAQAVARWPILRCAHVVSVVQRVELDRHKTMLAVDASREHDAILGGIRDLQKDPRKQHPVRRFKEQGAPDRFEIIPPKGGGPPVQLSLPIDGFGGSLSEALAMAIKQWRSWEGLRHYSAMLRIFSVEGAREGRARWTMARHLDAIDASIDKRQDPAYLAKLGAEVELMTKLELAIYAPDGSLRMRQPLFRPGTKFDKLHGSTWALDGLELEIHPWLYRGVRDLESGKLGSNWYPQSAALPTVDHRHFPYAYPLGLILPIRWLWDWKDGRDHLRISGSKLLSLAGIPFDARRPGEAWTKLRRNLTELARLDPPAVGRVEWEGEANTLGGIVLLYAPQWARDRTIHKLPPVEPSKAALAPPMTGAELAAWREREGLSQAAAAKQLGVGLRTVERAESDPKLPLKRALLRAFACLAKV